MTHPGVPGACGTPDSLRALKRILPQHDTLLKKIDAHADAWEADIREKHELARMHANEYGNLRIANANAQVAKAQADNAALRDECQVLRQRLAKYGQHLPGCMEPGLCDDDCVCGWTQPLPPLPEVKP